MMTDKERSVVVEAVVAADLCCPEQVCDMVLAVADGGGDWRAELARAVVADVTERRVIGLEN